MRIQGLILLAFGPDFPGELIVTEYDQVRAAAPDARLLVTQDRDEIQAVLDEIEIITGGFPFDLLAQAHSLRWFQQFGAGVEWMQRYPELIEQDFILTNGSGVSAGPMSDHIFAFMLAFARAIPYAVRYQQHREWPPRTQEWYERRFELAGRTLLLIGVGDVGQRAAQKAAAFGMRVLGVRRNPTISAPCVETMYGPHQLLEALPQADFVALALPLTHETRGMIGEAELRAMKRTAYIINVGRGATIQEDVLIRALQEGWIAGAGLDAFVVEPLPPESPLWEMENVIITSHYGGYSSWNRGRTMAIFLENLRRYQADERLHNVVDKKLGY